MEARIFDHVVAMPHIISDTGSASTKPFGKQKTVSRAIGPSYVMSLRHRGGHEFAIEVGTTFAQDVEKYVGQIKATGGDATVYVYPGEGHAFMNSRPDSIERMKSKLLVLPSTTAKLMSFYTVKRFFSNTLGCAYSFVLKHAHS